MRRRKRLWFVVFVPIVISVALASLASWQSRECPACRRVFDSIGIGTAEADAVSRFTKAGGRYGSVGTDVSRCPDIDARSFVRICSDNNWVYVLYLDKHRRVVAKERVLY
jgi:hypothetical protein